MKLIRYGKAGAEKTGVIYNGKRLDVSGFASNFDEAFFESDGLAQLKEYVATGHGQLPVVSEDERLGCPVGRPSKIVCIGLNYADH
ncbi:MAG TPA: ureidoglycolate lyase, partial [Bacteroidetes bacterium]|nr:ureidoglycolate lyase [Bacteroidota bacterium]